MQIHSSIWKKNLRNITKMPHFPEFISRSEFFHSRMFLMYVVCCISSVSITKKQTAKSNPKSLSVFSFLHLSEADKNHIINLIYIRLCFLIKNDQCHKYQIGISGIGQCMTVVIRCVSHISCLNRAYGSIIIIITLTC